MTVESVDGASSALDNQGSDGLVPFSSNQAMAIKGCIGAADARAAKPLAVGSGK
jgi:hypothetical protein